MCQARAMRRCAGRILLATSLLFFSPPSLRGTGMQSHSDQAVDYNASYLVAITGTTGIFGFAGHPHAVLASAWSADLKMNFNDLAHSTAAITVPTDKLVIDSSEARKKAGLGKGPGESDVTIIQKRMLSSEVLDASQYPQIKFTATGIKAEGNGRLQVAGNMEIHGRSHPVTVPVRYHSDGQQTEFDGEFNIRQTDYGMKPESVAGGTVKVKDSLTVKFHVVMKAAQ